MGAKCSKAKKEAVSENVDADKLNEHMENDALSDKRSQRTESLIEDLSKAATEDYTENETWPPESRKSMRNSNVDLDSGFTPGLLPFQNSSMSVSAQDSVAYNDEVNEVNETHGSLEGSRHNSVDEDRFLTKENSLSNSRDSFASTYVSDDVADPTIEMRTYTPFDMKKTDEVAKFLVSRCGFGLDQDHDPQKCNICQTVDLSDAPLIA